jgi:hypothetical protein
VLPGADEVAASLDLDPDRWDTTVCEDRVRAVKGPDGQEATLTDSVVRARRSR